MKHTFRITIFLTIFFLLSQIIGLFIVDAYIDVKSTETTGELQWKELPSIAGFQMERPDITPQQTMIYVGMAILVGTLLILLIIKLGTMLLWKLWFFIAITVCLQVGIGAFLPDFFALILAVFFALYKIISRNAIVHNVTEVFIYGGLAAMFVPVLNVVYAFIMLIALSLYDMYAVWKSKHMVKMATFQTESGLFAGFFVPYKVKKTARIAVLGGGDIGFPLIFAGVVLKTQGFLPAIIVASFVTLSLLGLLMLSRQNKFYPAMPFLTAGCSLGYLVSVLI